MISQPAWAFWVEILAASMTILTGIFTLAPILARKKRDMAPSVSESSAAQPATNGPPFGIPIVRPSQTTASPSMKPPLTASAKRSRAIIILASTGLAIAALAAAAQFLVPPPCVTYPGSSGVIWGSTFTPPTTVCEPFSPIAPVVGLVGLFVWLVAWIIGFADAGGADKRGWTRTNFVFVPFWLGSAIATVYYPLVGGLVALLPTTLTVIYALLFMS